MLMMTTSITGLSTRPLYIYIHYHDITTYKQHESQPQHWQRPHSGLKLMHVAVALALPSAQQHPPLQACNLPGYHSVALVDVTDHYSLISRSSCKASAA